MGVKQGPKKMTSKVEAGLEDTFPIRKAVCTLDYNLGLVEDCPKACNWPVSVLGRNWSSVLTPKLKTYLNANAFVSFCFCCLHVESEFFPGLFRLRIFPIVILSSGKYLHKSTVESGPFHCAAVCVNKDPSSRLERLFNGLEHTLCMQEG